MFIKLDFEGVYKNLELLLLVLTILFDDAVLSYTDSHFTFLFTSGVYLYIDDFFTTCYFMKLPVL
jgi:hypothetical protein